MADKKKGLIQRWVDGARAKAEVAIRAKFEPGEELLEWTGGQTSPPEFFGFIPGLALYHKLKTRHWITALTDRRLLLLRHSASSLGKILETKAIPLARVRGMRMKRGVLFVALVVDAPGGPWTFKEMEREITEKFIARFKEAKRAAAGGN